jgi:hypothetical protein
MGRDLILWKPQEIANNVVLGQYCTTHHNILTQYLMSFMWQMFYQLWQLKRIIQWRQRRASKAY